MRRILISIVTLLLLLPAVSASAVELLTNGGFETGDLTGWTRTNVQVEKEYAGIHPKTGEWMAVLSPGPISYNGLSIPLGFNDAAIGQSFLPGGYTVATISFDYNLQALDLSSTVDNGIDSLVSIIATIGPFVVGSFTAPPLNDQFDVGGPKVPTIQGWEHFSTTATDPTGLPSGPFVLAFSVLNCPFGSLGCTTPTGDPGSGQGDPGQLFSAYLDNISIDVTNPVPEPSTVLLVGSGILGLLPTALEAIGDKAEPHT